MIQEYCQNCGRVTGHKRAVGMGTFLGACMTLGTSLMATPFYPKRCVVCGCKTSPPERTVIPPIKPPGETEAEVREFFDQQWEKYKDLPLGKHTYRLICDKYGRKDMRR
jgi:hypothetical protein